MRLLRVQVGNLFARAMLLSLEVNACCGSENSTATVVISTFLSKVRVMKNRANVNVSRSFQQSPCRCHFYYGPWGPFGEICSSQALFLHPDMMGGGFSLCV